MRSDYTINTPWFENIFEPKLFPYKYPNILYSVILHTYPPMKMEQSVPKRRHKIQMPGNYSEESIQRSEHGENLKSITILTCSNSQPDDGPTGSKHVVAWILYKDVFGGYLLTPLRSNYSVTAFDSRHKWRLPAHMNYRLTCFLSALESSHGLTILCSTSLRSTRQCTTLFYINTNR